MSTLTVTASSHYSTVYNQFGLLAASLKQQSVLSSSLDGELLVIENSDRTSAMVAESSVSADGYTYSVRGASLRNKPGKLTSWGIIFNRTDDHNYCSITLQCENSALYDDLTDRRQMRVSVNQCVGGIDETLLNVMLDKDVDLYDGLNTVSVSVRGQEATIEVGKKKLQRIGQVNIVPADIVQVGLCLGADAKIAVERSVVTTETTPLQRVVTAWTLESLDEHFALSADPIEGYWTYQDRDMEERLLRLGGRYTVAVVAGERGYDIIYVSGAQVNAQQWCVGLLKGRISKTIFDGHYDLMWIDAMFLPIAQDAFASFDNGVLLTLNFPLFKSQMRLSKVLSNE